MTPPLLVARALSKRFGAFQALRDVGFSVHDGEILGLIGPNGSGKTTLFQCVAGLLPADEGDVIARGVRCGAEQRRETLFYMPDNIRPWADQRVGWALGFIASQSGATPADIAEITESLGLAQLLRSHMRALSKGEHKRVLLALGLLTTQPLLLLDEPFDGLDLRQAREAMDVLRRYAARGRTLFLSIHQLADAARICDRLILLSGGRTVAEGTLDALRRAAGFDASREAPLDEVFLALT